MYLFVWIFFVYAFLGWCTEVSYAALVTGKFVNRGFLNGPVCPIYGFGVVIVLGCLTPLRENGVVLFLGSVLLTSLLELVTGFVLEKVFHQRWWDYSDQPFNLGGYVCLRFSIAWGFACMFVVNLLHPTVLLFIRLIPHTLGLVLLAVLGAVMAVDLVATVHTITKINRSLSEIDALAGRIKELSNEFGENLANKVLDAAETGAELKEDLQERHAELREDFQERKAGWREDVQERRAELAELRRRLDQALEQRTFGQRRLMRAFPRMRSVRHHQALERLRQHMDRRESK